MELIKKYSLLNFNYRFIILSIILFSSFFSLAQGEKINWMTFAEAIEAQKIKQMKQFVLISGFGLSSLFLEKFEKNKKKISAHKKKVLSKIYNIIK